MPIDNFLMLRSGPLGRVSKHAAPLAQADQR